MPITSLRPPERDASRNVLPSPVELPLHRRRNPPPKPPDPAPAPARSPLRRFAPVLIVLAVIAVSITATVRDGWPLGAPDYSHLQTATAQRRAFRVVSTERGQLESMRTNVLASQVRRRTTILSIVPEGSLVEAGQVVCELDAAELLMEEKEEQILATKAEANLRKAEENLKIRDAQNESNLAARVLALDLARMDLEGFSDGEFPQQKNALSGQITLAEEDLRRAHSSYTFSKESALKGYKTQNEVEADRIAVSKAQISLEVAREKLNVLETYTQRRQLAELSERVANGLRELGRIERAGRAAMAQLQAAHAAATLTYNIRARRLELIREQIASCRIVAPQAGEVIYANMGNSNDVIQEGTAVRERQAILEIPDLTQMKVTARVHEARIRFVRQGLPVTVSIDAYKGETFRGTVHSVAAVPSRANRNDRDLREFTVVIRIDDDPERTSRLRPGLTAELEIESSYRPGVLQVPVKGVATINGAHYAYVLATDGPERRLVCIGEFNDRSVEILDGIAEGEQVVLNPRAHFARELDQLHPHVNSLATL